MIHGDYSRNALPVPPSSRTPRRPAPETQTSQDGGKLHSFISLFSSFSKYQLLIRGFQCTNCAGACKRCDDSRPCERCVKYGIADTCVDGTRKERKKGIKRGPYKRKSKFGSNEAAFPSRFFSVNYLLLSYHIMQLLPRLPPGNPAQNLPPRRLLPTLPCRRATIHTIILTRDTLPLVMRFRNLMARRWRTAMATRCLTLIILCIPRFILRTRLTPIPAPSHMQRPPQ